MRKFSLPALLILTACATPQQQCIGAATRDMRVVDQLIAETQATLARGYAIENKTVYSTQWVKCGPRPTAENPQPKQDLCLGDVPQTVSRPVAVDLNAEAATLASLKAKRAKQAKAAAAAVKSCQAQYPE